MIKHYRWAGVIWVVHAISCGSSGNGSSSGGTDESGSQGGAGAGILGVGGATGCDCASNQVCVDGQCVTDLGTCSTDNDCQSDSFCSEGQCLPYGEDTKLQNTSCVVANESFPSSDLVEPALKCAWEKSYAVVTPMVGDLNGDAMPEVVFVSGSPQGSVAMRLVAISGSDCSEVFSVPLPIGTTATGDVAIADLTGDGMAEIIVWERTLSGPQRLAIYDNQGQLVTTPGVSTCESCFGQPAVANLDFAGPPEIIFGTSVWRYEGGALSALHQTPTDTGFLYGSLTAVADVDLDGAVEIVTGSAIIDALTGADKTPPIASNFPGGYPAIAQIDKTSPEPEVILVSRTSANQGYSALHVYNPGTGVEVFGPYRAALKEYSGGPPTVADFDGDGEPEIGVAGSDEYIVFDPDCAKSPLPADCAEPGVRWKQPIHESPGGGYTGSSVFDLNGDGAAEVIYRDVCFLRAYDGKTGTVLFETPSTSSTLLEMPVIADTDNDGHADIVVPAVGVGPASGGGCVATKQQDGVYIYQDPANHWMPSRPIWNQYAYHITNINDDASVPAIESNNWDTWNNYRQNSQGQEPGGAKAADLTGKGLDSDSNPTCESPRSLTAQICNRGTAHVGAGVSGTFYLGDPRSSGTVICTSATVGPLPPGSCETVSCQWPDAPNTASDVWFSADDAGLQTGKTTECLEANNLLHMPQLACEDPGTPD